MAAPARRRFSMLLLLASFLLLDVQGHNWLHMRSRVGKLSTKLPAPPASKYHRPVIQVGARQEFGIQFVNGHPGTDYFFAVLHASDSWRLVENTEQILLDYIKRAPANASDDFRHERFRKVHVARKRGPNDGSRYQREILPGDALFPDRTGLVDQKCSPGQDNCGDPPTGVRIWKYNSNAHQHDRLVSYRSDKYPWLEAVFRYRVYIKWTTEWDYARIFLPAWRGSGSYLIHMVWRGYRDVLDVDVLPAPAKDIYGRPGGKTTYRRIDHCQYKHKVVNGTAYKYATYSTKNAKTCYVVPPGGSVDSCLKRATYLSSGGKERYEPYGAGANVVPLHQPSSTTFPDAKPNIPFMTGSACSGSNHGDCKKVASDSCNKNKDLKNLPKGTLVCYPLRPPPPTSQVGVTYTVSHDPEDPVFYSTCFERESDWVFKDNPPCPQCGRRAPKAADEGTWRFGDRCVSCADAQKYGGGPSSTAASMEPQPVDNATLFAATAASPAYVAPTWSLAETCKAC